MVVQDLTRCVTVGDNTAYSEGGKDSLTGAGGDDVLVGGDDDDTIVAQPVTARFSVGLEPTASGRYR